MTMKGIDGLSQPVVLGDNGGPVVVGFIIVALESDSAFVERIDCSAKELRYLSRCECLFSALHCSPAYMVGRFSL